MKKIYKKVTRALFSNYVVKAFSLYSLSQVISAVISFGILSLYTKILSPTDFGKISLIWMFVVVASILIDGRLNTAYSIKFYKSSKEENTINIYSIFSYYLIAFSIFYLTFLYVPSLFENILGMQIMISDFNIIFLLILVMIFGNFYTNFLMISKKPKSYFFVMLIFNAALVASSLVYLLILKAGCIAYLKAYLISYLILSLFGLRFFLSNYKLGKKIISAPNLKNLLHIGLPLVPDALLLMLLTWADRYVLNIYSGMAIVGIYSVGYRFSEVINSFVISPFGQASSPILFEKFTTSLPEYKRIMGQFLKYYWLVILSIITAYFVILKETYQLFIGTEYMEGYNIIGFVLLGIIIGGASSLLSVTVVMREKTKYMFLLSLVSVSLNIGLNFLFIPEYGMYGAAIATLASYILKFILVFSYTQKLVFISYDYRFIFKSILISGSFLALVIFVSYLKFNTFYSIGIKAGLFLIFISVIYNIKEMKHLWKRFLLCIHMKVNNR